MKKNRISEERRTPRRDIVMTLSRVGAELGSILADAMGLPFNGMLECLLRQEAHRMGVYRKAGDETDWGSMVVMRKGAKPGVYSANYTAEGDTQTINTTLTLPGYYYLQQYADKENVALNVAVELLIRTRAKAERVVG